MLHKFLNLTFFKNNFFKDFISRVFEKITLKTFSFKNFSSLFFVGIVIAVIICSLDLYTKKYIFNLIDNYTNLNSLTKQNYPEIKVFEFFSLVKVWNTGVSFGMFSKIENSEIIFVIIQGGIGLALMFWLYQVKKIYIAIALGLVIGGAFGNTVDRVMNGAVADFLDFYLGSYHWPAFNLADSAIFIGIMVLIFDEFFINKFKKNV
ncbi:hypothetical protein LBMAG18_00260 [Alphaproteobacteria bacterium]|nr:hypothetical protein LBMAG18_00260 [Alphaproteobacteria bacterium]